METKKEEAKNNEPLIKTIMFGGGVDDLNKSGIPDTSKQAPAQDYGFSDKIIIPPYDPDTWSKLLELNTRLKKCIYTYAQNTVGAGWDIILNEEFVDPSKVTAQESTLINYQKKTLRDFFSLPNNQESFVELMKKEKIDEEATGTGYLEISRNMLRNIDGVYHCPSRTIRILKNEEGFVQIRGTKKVYFKGFGDKRMMDKDTGEFKEEKDLPFEQRANEIISFPLYASSSDYYGIPRYVSASPAIGGNRLSAIRNVSFFKNDAVPRMMILVSGGKLTGESVHSIQDFIEAKGKGPQKAHRIMVLQAESKGLTLSKENAVKINAQPLTVGETDDASFIKYRTANDEEIREAFGMGKIFLGTTDDVNKASAAVSRQVTIEQEFIPDQKAKEFRINHTICKDILSKPKTIKRDDIEKFYANELCKEERALLKKQYGLDSETYKKFSYDEKLDQIIFMMRLKNYEVEKIDESGITFRNIPLVKLVFIRPQVASPSEQAEIDKIYAEYATYTINELRVKIGLTKIEEDWASKPLAILTLEGVKSASIINSLLEIRDGLRPNTSLVGDEGKEFFHERTSRKSGK